MLKERQNENLETAKWRVPLFMQRHFFVIVQKCIFFVLKRTNLRSWTTKESVSKGMRSCRQTSAPASSNSTQPSSWAPAFSRCIRAHWHTVYTLTQPLALNCRIIPGSAAHRSLSNPVFCCGFSLGTAFGAVLEAQVWERASSLAQKAMRNGVTI